MRRPRRSAHPRYFVTGTDTGVGKTEVALALLRLMRRRGFQPFALKPYQSGGGDDARRLGARVLYRFRAPLAPGVAAELEGVHPSFTRVVAAVPRRGAGVVEGAGGLKVPLDARHDVIDLIAALKLPVVLVARLGLGTLNHTALSVEALLRRKLKVEAVVPVKSTPGRDPSEAHNVRWLSSRHPGLRILGPVGFHPRSRERLLALERVLTPLVP